MGIRLLPSSSDSSKNLSRTPLRTRTEIMINQATPWLGIFKHSFILTPSSCPYSKKGLKCMHCLLLQHALAILINLSLAFTITCLFIWNNKASGWPWHVEPLELDLWPRHHNHAPGLEKRWSDGKWEGVGEGYIFHPLAFSQLEFN
jgi:hypothetical protein